MELDNTIQKTTPRTYRASRSFASSREVGVWGTKHPPWCCMHIPRPQHTTPSFFRHALSRTHTPLLPHKPTPPGPRPNLQISAIKHPNRKKSTKKYGPCSIKRTTSNHFFLCTRTDNARRRHPAEPRNVRRLANRGEPPDATKTAVFGTTSLQRLSREEPLVFTATLNRPRPPPSASAPSSPPHPQKKKKKGGRGTTSVLQIIASKGPILFSNNNINIPSAIAEAAAVAAVAAASALKQGACIKPVRKVHD